MPIYAFACAACGHHFDKLQKLSDPDPEVCPACAAIGQIRRQLTAPVFRLSGSGWYETDFKQGADKKRNLAGEGGEGAKPAADGAAKPAAATADKPVADQPAAGKRAADQPARNEKPAAKPAAAPDT